MQKRRSIFHETRITIFVVFFVAIVLRFALLVLSTHDPQATADSAIYVGIAHGIVDTGEFVRKYLNHYEIVTERVPAYPAFLAFFIKLFSDPFDVALVFQCIIDSVTCVLIALIGRELSYRLFLPSGLLAAVNLNLMIHATLVLTDTLFMFFFTGFLFALVKFYSNSLTRWGVISSAALSIAILTRPIMYYFFPIFFGLLLVILYMQNRPWISVVRLCCAALAIASCLVGPLLLRNYSHYGHFELVSSGGSAAMEWYTPLARQYAIGENIESVIRRQKDTQNKWFETASREEIENPFLVSKLQLKIAKEELMKMSFSQIIYAWLGGATINIFVPSITSLPDLVQMKRPRFFETEGKDFMDKTLNFLFHPDNRLYVLLVVPSILITLLSRAIAVIGLAVHAVGSASVRNKLFILLIPAFYILVITGPLVSAARYRLPLEPALILLTAVGLIRINDIWNYRAHNRSKQ